jgi:hypothetical protein
MKESSQASKANEVPIREEIKMLQIHNQCPLGGDYKIIGVEGGKPKGRGTISVSLPFNQVAGNGYLLGN